jgi:hypothetical protein
LPWLRESIECWKMPTHRSLQLLQCLFNGAFGFVECPFGVCRRATGMK